MQKLKSLRILALVGLWLIIGLTTSCANKTNNHQSDKLESSNYKAEWIVQLAELKIDPDQLNKYLAFLNEEIEMSLDKEPGVLSLYSMQELNDPASIKIMEVYADQKSYESHIASSHFQKYKQGTLDMVDSLKLTRMNPINLSSKIK